VLFVRAEATLVPLALTLTPGTYFVAPPNGVIPYLITPDIDLVRVGVGVGVGVAVGVGVGVAVPTTLKQLLLALIKVSIVVFDAAQKLLALAETTGFIIEFAQVPELSTCPAPKL